MSQDHIYKPYVPMSVEELSNVTSLERWTNTQVRVIGEVVPPSNLMSLFENGGPYYIELDFGMLCDRIPPKIPVQIFGHLNLVNGKPRVTVLFSRNMDGDIQSYQKALDLQMKYIPHFIKPKPLNSENDSVQDT